MDIETAFGTVIRTLRYGKGWSQEKLAVESKVDRNYISLIELGRNSPSIKTIFRLCGALGISVAECMAQVENLIPD